MSKRSRFVPYLDLNADNFVTSVGNFVASNSFVFILNASEPLITIYSMEMVYDKHNIPTGVFSTVIEAWRFIRGFNWHGLYTGRT